MLKFTVQLVIGLFQFSLHRIIVTINLHEYLHAFLRAYEA